MADSSRVVFLRQMQLGDMYPCIAIPSPNLRMGLGIDGRAQLRRLWNLIPCSDSSFETQHGHGQSFCSLAKHVFLCLTGWVLVPWCGRA